MKGSADWSQRSPRRSRRLKNLQFLQSRKELPKIPPTNCLCKWAVLSKPPLHHQRQEPFKRKDTSGRSWVPQHQVRVPCQDKPHLSQTGEEQQQHPHTQIITAQVSGQNPAGGRRNICPSKEELGLVWNASQRLEPRQASSSSSSSFCWLKKAHQHKSSGSYLTAHLRSLSPGSVLSGEAVPCQAEQ